ncbi:aflatoxin regulatory protein-domain-containing protein [Aspergillus varians]
MTDSVASESASSLGNSHRVPKGQQPRKLRDSCIHCANSKVKCNKEKPVCGRCTRRHLNCEYKVSRRTGRTSRVVNQLSGMETGTRTTEASITPPVLHPASMGSSTTAGMLSSTLAPSGPSRTPLLSPITTIPAAHSSPEHCIVQTPDIWRSILSPSAFNADVGDFSSLMPMGTDVGDIFASVMPSPQFDNCDIDTLPAQGMADSVSVTEHRLFPTPALSETKTAGAYDITSNHRTCCLTIVLNIFKDLFPNPPTGCKCPGSQQGPDKARTIESVISENKQILDTINAVLDCPCSHDGYIISIVSLAVFKVMGWYIAAARDRIPASEDSMRWRDEVPTYSGRGSSVNFHEQVLRSPAVVGSYCIDSRNQNRMAAQLVLSELHRVQRLVNVLSSRLESIRLSSCLSSASTFGSTSAVETVENSLLAAFRTSPLSGSTYAQLEEDLRKRLRSISSETIDILRRE